MPQRKSGPAPDPSTPQLPAPRPAKVWETGEAPDDGRIPGTRRLWLAGALALAVVSSCVTALVLQGGETDDSSRDDRTGRTTSAGDAVTPGITLPASPTSAPDGKSGLSKPQNAGESAKGESDDAEDKGSDDDSDSSSKTEQGGAEPKPDPKPSKPSDSKKPPSSSTSSSWKSVRSVNYPDRYWHLSNGAIRLDPVSSGSGSETREDASFKVVSGLANSSCYSFRMEDGRYVRHQNFRLRVSGNDGSQLFKQDATFCPRSYGSDTVMLESVNYPGYYLRHRSFELRLERFEYSQPYMADASFKLVKAFSS